MAQSKRRAVRRPPDVQAFIDGQLSDNYRKSDLDIRKQDEAALRKLLKRGKIGTKYSVQGQKDLKEIETKAR